MSAIKLITIQNQTFQLLPEKALFWNEEKMLILSDLHLGKSGHFRKSGIPAPAQINSKTLGRLTILLEQYTPETVLILGDLFHSDANREWFEFEDWLLRNRAFEFILVTGNHDSLHPSFYHSANLAVYAELSIGPFLFVHDTNKINHTGHNITLVGGHIHPAVKLKGKGRQSLRFPAFIISENRILLPAFGEFTGLFTITPNETEQAYAVVDVNIIPINS